MKPLHWPVCARSLGRTACNCRASSSKQHGTTGLIRRGRPHLLEDVPAQPGNVSLPYCERVNIEDNCTTIRTERDCWRDTRSSAILQNTTTAVGQRYLLPPRNSVALETPVLRSTGFQVQTNEPSSPPGNEKQADYYANVGDAIRTLRDDIPALFVKDLNCKHIHE
jgi:hypothetical protein